MLGVGEDGVVFPTDRPGRTIVYSDRAWGAGGVHLCAPGPPHALRVPPGYSDPVSGEALSPEDNPLLASDGYTYAADTLQQLRFPYTSPLTREVLRPRAFRNRILHALHGSGEGGARTLFRLGDVGNCVQTLPVAEVESGDCWAWLLSLGWREGDIIELGRRATRDGWWGPPPLPIPDEVARHVAHSLHLSGENACSTTWCAMPGGGERLLDEWIAATYPGLDASAEHVECTL